ncbi:MAG: hypothetical protein WAW88_11605 [Nocardioides sp.]
MTDFREPRTEIEWSRRAIINVVKVLEIHSVSLTLVGAHAVLLRTMDLDVPRMPTGDGDLGVTPGLVGAAPSIGALLAAAGYEHRTTARPGLWGRRPYDEIDGTQSFREKIDLLAPHGLSGTRSRTKRSVPALQAEHGKLAVGNALGLELAAFNRSRMTIPDLADPRLSGEIFVAEIPALLLAKGSKVGERVREPRKGPVRDKDLGDLWRLMAVADPAETSRVIEEFMDHPQVGLDVRQSVAWTGDVLGDPVSVERAKLAFDTFVDPAEIDRVFALWRESMAMR